MTSGRIYKQVGSAARLSSCGGRFFFGGDPGESSGKHPAGGFCAAGPALGGWYAQIIVLGCVPAGTRPTVSRTGGVRPCPCTQPYQIPTRRGKRCQRLRCRTLAPSRNPAAARRAAPAARVRIANRPCRFIFTVCEPDPGRRRSAQSRRFAATATCDFHSHHAADAFRPVPLASRWVDRSRMTDDP